MADDSETSGTAARKSGDRPKVAPKPPVPKRRSAPPPPRADERWLVSEGDGHQDVELGLSELVNKIKAGEVKTGYLVWRPGLEEWLSIEAVPRLAAHLPNQGPAAGEVQSTGVFFDPDELDAKLNQPVALSKGLLFGGDTPPPPKTKGQPLKPKPKSPNAVAAGAQPRFKVDEPEQPEAPLPQAEEIEAEPEPPSSGTPTLSALTALTEVDKPEKAQPRPDPFADLTASDSSVLGPPSIDIAEIEAEGRSEKPEKGEPSEGAEPAEPGARSTPERSTETLPERGAAEPEPLLSPFRLLLLAAVGLGLWLLIGRSSPTPPEPESASRGPAPNETPAPKPKTKTAHPAPIPSAATPAPSGTGEALPEPPEPPPAPSKRSREPRAEPTYASGEPEPQKPLLSTGRPEKEPEEQPKEEQASVTAAQPESALGPFDRNAAAQALNAAVAEASGCRKEGDPSGMARVKITFAPSGRVTTAIVQGPPFVGTKTGGCIAATLRRAKVPPFTGSLVTVGKTVVIR